MKVKIRTHNEEILGVDLIAENNVEENIIQRFWNGGIKINGILSSKELYLTFKDLIGK